MSFKPNAHCNSYAIQASISNCLDDLRRQKMTAEDPILASYTAFTAEFFQFLNDDTSRQVNRVRRSIYSATSVPPKKRDEFVRDIYDFYNPLREFIKESIIRPRGGQPRLRSAPHQIYSLYRDYFPRLRDGHAKIVANRRQCVRIPTKLDADFMDCLSTLEDAGGRVLLLEKALDGDDSALRHIYSEVLGDRLAQKSAPYQFDIESYVLRVREARSDINDRDANLSRSISFLAVQARKLADGLKVSNIDKRFEAALEEYYTMIVNNFDPILVDLYANKLRAFLIELRQELPNYVIAETSAMLLSQEQILRQFPEWREFATAAATFDPNPEQEETHRNTIAAIAHETKVNPSVVSLEVSVAFDRLDDAALKRTTTSTVKLGTWRSLENFTKENIRKLIDLARGFSERTSLGAAENRYLQFIEKLLPHLKLVIRMVDSLHWLEPVLAWIEEVLKKRRPS